MAVGTTTHMDKVSVYKQYKSRKGDSKPEQSGLRVPLLVFAMRSCPPFTFWMCETELAPWKTKPTVTIPVVLIVVQPVGPTRYFLVPSKIGSKKSGSSSPGQVPKLPLCEVVKALTSRNKKCVMW
jgi:hypothetical protein